MNRKLAAVYSALVLAGVAVTVRAERSLGTTVDAWKELGRLSREDRVTRDSAAARLVARAGLELALVEARRAVAAGVAPAPVHEAVLGASYPRGADRYRIELAAAGEGTWRVTGTGEIAAREGWDGPAGTVACATVRATARVTASSVEVLDLELE